MIVTRRLLTFSAMATQVNRTYITNIPRGGGMTRSNHENSKRSLSTENTNKHTEKNPASKMKIESVNVFQLDLPLDKGTYTYGGGKSVSVFDSTIVEIITDTGIKGYGEICPCGPYYMPSYPGGVRAGLAELIPPLLGSNPLELGKFNQLMDEYLKGHSYVKSALDIACWDILGKHSKLPLYTLLGGRYGNSMPLYGSLPQCSDEETRRYLKEFTDQGFKIIQLKVGGDVPADIKKIRWIREALPPSYTLVVDANGSWLGHEALKVVKAVSDLDIYVEQPCDVYEDCLNIRTKTDLPFILDESINNTNMIARAEQQRMADVLKFKLSKQGGMTKSKLARDLCIDLGLAVGIEETWGCEIATAAVAHLAVSTPDKFLFETFDFSSYSSVRVAHGAPTVKNGRMSVSDRPGLGVEPIMEVLGKPIMSFSKSFL